MNARESDAVKDDVTAPPTGSVSFVITADYVSGAAGPNLGVIRSRLRDGDEVIVLSGSAAPAMAAQVAESWVRV